MSEATRVINHRFGEGPHHAPEYRSTNGLLLQSQEEVEAKVAEEAEAARLRHEAREAAKKAARP